ncbi:hypothetical protein GCM10011504_32630 [Siccirubricoccus deserti]|nr:hypothetical protein GCM10011504_32630 [Siccirubricoccus deserti]
MAATRSVWVSTSRSATAICFTASGCASGRGVGKTGGLDHHMPDRPPLRHPGGQAVERPQDVAAHRAAEAAGIQRHGILLPGGVTGQVPPQDNNQTGSISASIRSCRNGCWRTG